jgi:HEAT repeat protein
MSVIGKHPLPPEIISLLLDAARSDANPGVRLTAVESLRNFVEEPQVADALGEVLKNDENAGVRMQAIDLLGTNKPASMIGVLQNVVEREPDGYIRMRVAKALQEMNASVGTF